MFAGHRFYLHNLPKKKKAIFTEKIQSEGGKVVSNELEASIIVSDTVYSKAQDSIAKIVKTAWISKSLVNGKAEEAEEFFEECISESSEEESAQVPAKRKAASFVCMQSSKEPSKKNELIMAKLKEILENHRINGDKWRVLGYQRAISAIKNYPYEITSASEAGCIRGIGRSIADKIGEILESGAVTASGYEEGYLETMKLFTAVWGAGPATAKNWYLKGYRTLSDLGADLTRQQEIGVKYYSDILERMTWKEAEDIVNRVQASALAMIPSLVVCGAGSFRRGKETCGDVDVLITEPCDAHMGRGFLINLVSALRKDDFIIEDLTEIHAHSVKFMGLVKSAGKARRLDILAVKYDEYPAALLYFTGSDLFNRSMRLYARKKGFALNEHGIFKNVVRFKSEKVSQGIRVPVSNEKDIFDILGLPFREPSERSH